MTKAASHSGHCRCGKIAMTATADSDFMVYCHCDDCRRATGSPVLASVAFAKSAINWESRNTLSRHTIGTATRLFCNNCGSPIAQEHESADDKTFFNIGFMDNPEHYPPSRHTFAGQQLSWLKLNDNLERVEKTVLIKTD